MYSDASFHKDKVIFDWFCSFRVKHCLSTNTLQTYGCLSEIVSLINDARKTRLRVKRFTGDLPYRNTELHLDGHLIHVIDPPRQKSNKKRLIYCRYMKITKIPVQRSTN